MLKHLIAQSAGAVEYTDCTSAEELSPSPAMSVLDMTPNNLMVVSSNVGALENAVHPFIAIAPRSTLARRGCTW